jgi:hypothetical protein
MVTTKRIILINMRQLVLLLSLVLYASAYYKIQYEKGVENSVHWAPTPYHVLHAGSGYALIMKG